MASAIDSGGVTRAVRLPLPQNLDLAIVVHIANGSPWLTDFFRHPVFHKPEGTLLCSRNALSADFARIIGLIEQGRLDTGPWITHRAAFEEVIDVFPVGEGAAVVHFWSRLNAGQSHPAGPHAVDETVVGVDEGKVHLRHETVRVVSWIADDRRALAVAQQVLTIPQVKLVRRLGALTAAQLATVEEAVRRWLGL